MAIQPALAAEVRALLARGVSQREVARRLPISRSTVHAIANGTWRGRHAWDTDDPDNPFHLVQPHRCGICGAMINTAQCVACTNRGLTGGEQEPPPKAA